MKLSSAMSRHFPCAASWTHDGSTYVVTDEGICYIVEFNGEVIGAIDGYRDLDTFAAANHWPADGTTYTQLSR